MAIDTLRRLDLGPGRRLHRGLARFEALRPGGTATIIGMIPVGQKLEGSVFLREKKIQGSSMGPN